MFRGNFSFFGAFFYSSKPFSCEGFHCLLCWNPCWKSLRGCAGGLQNKKCFSSEFSSSSITRFAIVFTGLGMSFILCSSSSRDSKGFFCLSERMSSMCFFPSPGSSSSWCLLIVIGPELLKKSRYFCFSSRTIFSIVFCLLQKHGPCF